MKIKKHVAILVCIVILIFPLIGCTKSTTETVASGNTQVQGIASEMFSDRDMESGYDESTSTILDLADDSIKISTESVMVVGNIVTIFQEGTYILRGSLSDGQILVDAKNSDKIQIILDTVAISSSSSAPIYVKQADKVFLTLANGSKNMISVHGQYSAIDDTTIDAAIFSKDDLTINGSGALTVTNMYGNGITSKDDLVLTNGIYDIKVSGHGLEAKDSIRISQGTFTIVSGKDGIHSENGSDTALGSVYIQNGNFSITADDDGIYGTSIVQINGGSITIPTSTEGIEGTYILINDGIINIHSTDDGINANKLSTYDVLIEINGGDITIVMASGDTDAIDSNGDIHIKGGTLDLTCGSSLDADGKIVYTGGTVIVNGETVTDFSASQIGGTRQR